MCMKCLPAAAWQGSGCEHLRCLTHVAEVDVCCVYECAFTVVPTYVLGVIVGVVSAHVCGRGWYL